MSGPSRWRSACAWRLKKRSAGDRLKTTIANTTAPIATMNAAIAPAVASTTAMSAGPSVKLTSMVTASSAKAVRRSSSRSKRWRHIVRVSVVMGVAKAPASAAKAATAANPQPRCADTSTAMSASGCTTPVTRSSGFAPRRSTNRPWNGAATAIATKLMPTAVPASAKLPNASRRNMSIANPTMPTGMRVSRATRSIDATPGCRMKAR